MADDQACLSDSPGTNPRAVPFAVVPDHELISLIGQGSYGEVWLAKSTLGTFRAVKIVYQRTFRHQRPFEREFNGVKKFEPLSRLHDGLMDVLQVGRNDTAGYFYYVMELADDAESGPAINPARYTPRTLASEITKCKRLPAPECRRIGAAIASALDFLHQRGLIHRDVKPSNIVFVNGAPKLADIGLVVEMSESRSYVGTEGFIPPEGPGTVQADIYSLGKVLYEISTGKDRYDYPALPEDLGNPVQAGELVEFNQIVVKACRAIPGDRYPSANAMVVDLLALANDDGAHPRTSARHLRQRALRAAAVVLGISAICGLLALTNQRGGVRADGGVSRGTGAPPLPAPVPAGLVAWWAGEGDAVDRAGGNHGTLKDHVSFTAGIVGRAFSFDRDGGVSLGNATNLQSPDFTIEAWIRRSDLSMVSFDTDHDSVFFSYGSRGYGFGLNNSGQVMLTQLDVHTLTAPASIVDTNWHHVAVAKSNTVVVFYVDGVAYPAVSPYLRRFSFATPVAIAARGDFLCHGFRGAIDELSVYNRPLSTGEVQAIHRAGSAGKSYGVSTVKR